MGIGIIILIVVLILIAISFPFSIGIIFGVVLIILAQKWISIYNDYIYLRTTLDERFAGIDVIMQTRTDMLIGLGKVAAKYSVHEYNTIKDTIEARSRWTKDTPLNEKVQDTQALENNFFKIQAIFEKYPKIKADSLYQQIMGSGSITTMERQLQEFRLSYNKSVRLYNEQVQIFPKSIVATFHNFDKAEYLILGNQVNQDEHSKYRPGDIFES